ncbi:hypothetical protein ABIC17_000497 [Sphingomonas sp. PvP056]
MRVATFFGDRVQPADATQRGDGPLNRPGWGQDFQNGRGDGDTDCPKD